jgi:sugar O-acyltransferase (sialic acid O-acetyltransferase NeuD family)
MNIPSNNRNITSVILYGGTGQAKVVRPIIEHQGVNIVAIFDDTNGTKPPFEDIPIYYGFESLIKWSKRNNIDNVGFVVCIGNPHGAARCEIAKKVSELGLIPYSVIDKSSIIADNCILGSGIQVMAGTVIMPEVIIGDQCIVNTKASIDHESIIEDGCEIGPGATLCGCVNMKVNSWVCAGATITPRCIIGKNSIVGAGAVVINNVNNNIVVAGVPAKEINSINKEFQQK